MISPLASALSPGCLSLILSPQMFSIQYNNVNSDAFMVDDIQVIGDIQINNS